MDRYTALLPIALAVSSAATAATVGSDSHRRGRGDPARSSADVDTHAIHVSVDK